MELEISSAECYLSPVDPPPETEPQRSHCWHGTTPREGLPSALEELRQAVELLADIDDPVADCYVLSAVAKCHADVAGGELDSDEVAAAVVGQPIEWAERTGRS